MAATAQSFILLEACNNIADSNKRLACLQELMNSRPAAIPQPDSSLEKVKSAFLGLRGTVSSGISYNAYSQQILEPASALRVYRASPKADAAAVGIFGAALKSYRDAQEVWRASIDDSTDAGAFGLILGVRRYGLARHLASGRRAHGLSNAQDRRGWKRSTCGAKRHSGAYGFGDKQG